MFGLKLLGTHAIMSIVQFLFMPFLFGIWQDNQMYQWFAGILYIAIFWMIIYADACNRGLQDSKNGVYAYHKGFAAGAIASLPPMVLYMLSIIFTSAVNEVNWFTAILRIWLVPYTKIFSSFEVVVSWLILAAIFLFPLVSGLSYMNGPRKRKKILETINKADSLKAQKSKVRP